MEALVHPRPLVSIAPMIDITNVFCRYFLRLLTSQATLYTQMIHHNAILKSDHDKMLHILRFSPVEHPLVLQLGGCDPEDLAKSCVIAQKLGYDEINLNCGCPSPRVQCGSFGACLMKEPKLVSQCLGKMAKEANIPCTVKCRLGVDDIEDYEFTREFVQEVSQNGHVNHFVVHARNAILKGLSPAENRVIPPLKYDYVYRLQKDFPHLNFTLNGGIKTIKQAKDLLDQHKLYGCMIGRTVYENPWQLSKIDSVIYNKPSKNYSKRQILQVYGQWADTQLSESPTLSRPMIIKPVLNLFFGCKNNAKFRQFISDAHHHKQYQTISELLGQSMKILDETDESYLKVRKYQE